MRLKKLKVLILTILAKKPFLGCFVRSCRASGSAEAYAKQNNNNKRKNEFDLKEIDCDLEIF